MTESSGWPTWPAPFGGATEPTPDEPWRLVLWWVNTADRWDLLFGWGFAWTLGGAAKGWAPYHHLEPRRSGPGLYRLVFNENWGALQPLLTSLSQGASIRTASARAGVPPPDEPLADLCLGDVDLEGRASASEHTFTAAPWRWLPARGSAGQGLASPLDVGPAVRAALVRVDKAALLPSDDKATALLETLDLDSGLRFSPRGTGAASDLPRLGDLEILRFPSADATSPRVEAPRVRASNDGVTIHVPAGLPGDTTVLVRCRQSHAGAILLDDLVEATASGEGSLAVTFDASPVGASGAEIEIWIPCGSVQPVEAGSHKKVPRAHRLWHAENAVFIRRIHTQLALIGRTINYDAAWINEWSKTRRVTKDVRARLDALRTVRRSSRGQEMRVGPNEELWAVAEKSATAYAEKLSPPTSGALFIPRRADPASDDRLAIAEWFVDLVDGSGSDGGPVMIVDPYFDDWGLDLIGHTRLTRRKFLVVTTSKTTSRDLDRHTRLRNEWTKRRTLIEDLRVEVLIVDSDLLHDRYVLVLDQGGDPVQGFHLSNSLQNAARTFPLLITPIPSDTLDAVADAMVEVLAEAEPLVLEEESNGKSVPLPPEPKKRTSEELSELASQVGGASDFKAAWGGYALARANTSQPREFGPWVKDLGWTKRLASLLPTMRAPESPRRPGTAELLGLAQAAERPALEQRHLDRVWTHGHGMLSSDWSTRFGYAALLSGDPELFVTVMEGDSSGAKGLGEQAAVDAGFRLHAALDALRELRFHLRTEPSRMRSALGALLSSGSPFVRALGGAWLGLEVLADEQPLERGTARALLEQLPSPDRQLVVADWIGDLRVRANRRNRVPEPAEETLRLLLMGWLVESWPDDGPKPELLRAVVERCEGPLLGAWAVSTTNDLLLPLAAKKLSFRVVADFWLGVLAERVIKLASDHHHFSLPTDSGLSQVCSWLIATSAGSADLSEGSLSIDPETKALVFDYIRQMERVRKSSSRVLERPFVRSLQYQAWDGANRSLAWLEGVALLALKIAPDIDEQSREFLDEWVRTGSRLVQVQGEDPSGLHPWLVEVRRLATNSEDTTPSEPL